MKNNVRSDLRHASTSYSEREDVQDDSEASSVVQFGEGGADENTGDGVAKLKMLPFSLGVTRMDNIMNGQRRWDGLARKQDRLHRQV